jgi:hypothetical protein
MWPSCVINQGHRDWVCYSQLHYNICSWFEDGDSVWYTTVNYCTCHLLWFLMLYSRLDDSHRWLWEIMSLLLCFWVCLLFCLALRLWFRFGFVFYCVISCCRRLTLLIIWHRFYNSLLSLAYSAVVFKVIVTILGCLWVYLALNLWFEFMEYAWGYTTTIMQIELKHFIFRT